MENGAIFGKLFFGLIGGAVSLMGLITFINPKLTQSISVNQGDKKDKITITPTNFLVSRIMGLVVFLAGIIWLFGVFTMVQ